MKDTNDKKWINMKIGLGSIVKEKVGEKEDNKREGIITRTRKEVVVCVQDVVGNNNFVDKFEYGENIKMIYPSLSYICEK